MAAAQCPPHLQQELIRAPWLVFHGLISNDSIGYPKLGPVSTGNVLNKPGTASQIGFPEGFSIGKNQSTALALVPGRSAIDEAPATFFLLENSSHPTRCSCCGFRVSLAHLGEQQTVRNGNQGLQSSLADAEISSQAKSKNYRIELAYLKKRDEKKFDAIPWAIQQLSMDWTHCGAPFVFFGNSPQSSHKLESLSG